jgi:AcrR family transcriptional regulator
VTPPRRPARPSTARARWTRDRIVSEALVILRAEGYAAVNTVRLSRASGIAQSGFYRYFPSIDACIEAAVAPIVAGFRDDVARRRRAWFATRSTDPAAGVEHYRENLSYVLANPSLAEIAVRRRQEASPVGRAMQALHDGMAADLLADLVVATGATSAHARTRLHLVSQVIVGASWTAIEALLAGTVTVAVAANLLAQLGSIVEPADPARG